MSLKRNVTVPTARIVIGGILYENLKKAGTRDDGRTETDWPSAGLVGIQATADRRGGASRLRTPHKLVGDENSCFYDCAKDGWTQHGRDGRFVYVGDSGDVIATATGGRWPSGPPRGFA
jgi:hypothetical protein